MERQVEELWHQVLSMIQKKISKPSYDTWLKSTKAVSLQDNVLTISTPNTFTQEWLENRYTKLILTAVRECMDAQPELHIITQDELETERRSASPEPAALIEDNILNDPAFAAMLNPKYTFDTFVVGLGNRFAHAAALAVAEAPGKAYNPLFLYGGVGLGKTHLMQAIGHYVLEHNPQAKVLYLSSEKFTNQFINAIMNNRGEAFRNKYRNIDVLLIDDIQFIAGKEQTQEEFFIPSTP